MRRVQQVTSRFRSPGARVAAAATAAAAVAAAAAVFAWAARVPYDREALEPSTLASVRVVDRNGTPLRITRGALGSRAEWVGLAQISPRVVQATLAAEDQRFFRHPGLDVRALCGAAYRNARAGHIVSGGSTLTQQLAGMVWPEPRTVPGKLREAARALRLEHDFSKREILEQYLNRAPYGNGANGIAAASERWLARGPQSLSASQAATLAALPQSPARLGRITSRTALQARRNRILARMERRGDLTAADAADAQARALELDPGTAPFAAPHFAARVLQDAAVAVPRAARLETTLDLELQAEVEGIVRSHLQALRGRGVQDMAVVVEAVDSGEILALVGSPDWSESQVNGALALRQPGSALKPFLYAAAFASGVSPADALPDLPFAALDGAHGEVAPRNYDGRWHGPVRAREALASSFNVPAVRLQERLGTRRVLDTLRRAGLESLDGDAGTYGLGLVLGVGEVTLLDLTTAYAGLARLGVYRAPQWLRSATDARGRALALPRDPPPRRWIDAAAAFQVADVLADDAARIPGFGSHSALDLPFAVAVKTGTSTDYRNSWCVGFTADHAVGVWLGNFDGTSLHGLAGASGAGPVFRSVMLRLRARGARPWSVTPPPGWEQRPVCTLSGARAGGDCPSSAAEWFAPGAWAGRAVCTWHHAQGGQVAVDWPPEYREWARGNGTLGFEASGAGTPCILSPVEGSVYFRDPRLPEQAMRFQSRVPSARDQWFLDGRSLGRGADAHGVWWSPAPGAHRLELRRDGAAHQIEFSVR